MKFTKAAGILSLMVVSAMSCQLTWANDEGWYIGGNLGQTRADIDEERIARSLADVGFSGALVRDDSIDHGFKLYGGYQVNRYVAIEGGYFDLGKFSFTSTTLPAGTFDGSIKLKGINIDLVGFVPITEKLSAFGRAGVDYADARDSFSGTGFVHVLSPDAKEKAANLKLGAGFQYAFTDKFALRFEGERYRINDAVGHKGDIDLISLGGVYRFGTTTPPPAPTPVAVVAPPAPVQPVTPQPAPRRFEKYTLSATELFSFDSSAVNLPQAKLEEIATAIKGEGSPPKVVIVGYTDRLGSDAYNQKLSERRALAVKEYMVGRGIDPNRLVAEGRGEAEPVVMCNDKNKADLINCLKPNRRVEIDEVKMVKEVKSK